MTGLAKRLVAHEVWKRGGDYGWQPGMAFRSLTGEWDAPLIVSRVGSVSGRRWIEAHGYSWPVDGANSAAILDIHNSGTRGYLLAQIKVMAALQCDLLNIFVSCGTYRGMTVALKRERDDGGFLVIASRDFEGDDAEAEAWLWIADRQEAG